MVRYVPGNPDFNNVFRESYEKNSQHKRHIGRCNCIYNELKTFPIFPPHLGLWRIYMVKISVTWVLINLLKIPIPEVFTYSKF